MGGVVGRMNGGCGNREMRRMGREEVQIRVVVGFLMNLFMYGGCISFQGFKASDCFMQKRLK